MAKIILRANLANKNFTIEHKVLKTPLASNIVELIISPNSNYYLDVNDFSNGALPNTIKSITYSSFGDKIKATLLITDGLKTTNNLNIRLPISGRARKKENNFFLTDTTGDLDTNIISNTNSDYNITSTMNGTTYGISVPLGAKKLLLRKTFVAPDGYYFTEDPSYTIVGNSTRYSIVSKYQTDDNENIVYKTCYIYYTAPSDISEDNNTDTINFLVSLSKKLDFTGEIKIAEKQEEYKIYSFDTGKNIGLDGGVKKHVITGVPGTPIRLIVSNSAGQTYNFNTGNFEDGGGMLSAVIPVALPNAAFGVYIAHVKVPRSSTNNTVKSQLVSQGLVDHDKIIDPEKPTSISSRLPTASDDTPAATFDNEYYVDTTFTFTFSLTNAAGSTVFEVPSTYVDDATGQSISTTVTIGPGKYLSPHRDVKFKVPAIGPDSGGKINIVRKPKHNPTKVFHAFDSAYQGDTTQSYDSDGNEILTDWDVHGDGGVVDTKNAQYTINLAARGTGEYASSDDSWDSVELYGTISGILFGKENITPELKLTNFLKHIA